MNYRALSVRNAVSATARFTTTCMLMSDCYRVLADDKATTFIIRRVADATPDARWQAVADSEDSRPAFAMPTKAALMDCVKEALLPR